MHATIHSIEKSLTPTSALTFRKYEEIFRLIRIRTVVLKSLVHHPRISYNSFTRLFALALLRTAAFTLPLARGAPDLWGRCLIPFSFDRLPFRPTPLPHPFPSLDLFFFFFSSFFSFLFFETARIRIDSTFQPPSPRFLHRKR